MRCSSVWIHVSVEADRKTAAAVPTATHKEKTAAQSAAVYQNTGAFSAPAFLRRDRLWEDDLDPAVLRLTHAVGGRNTLVVLAAAADHHRLPRHTEAGQSVGDVVGTPLGQPLIVPGRTGCVGVAGNLDLHRSSRTERVGGLLDDPHTGGRDRIPIPVEEHQEHP